MESPLALGSWLPMAINHCEQAPAPQRSLFLFQTVLTTSAGQVETLNCSRVPNPAKNNPPSLQSMICTATNTSSNRIHFRVELEGCHLLVSYADVTTQPGIR